MSNSTPAALLDVPLFAALEDGQWRQWLQQHHPIRKNRRSDIQEAGQTLEGEAQGNENVEECDNPMNNDVCRPRYTMCAIMSELSNSTVLEFHTTEVMMDAATMLKAGSR
jgi:hypothetical protein